MEQARLKPRTVLTFSRRPPLDPKDRTAEAAHYLAGKLLGPGLGERVGVGDGGLHGQSSALLAHASKGVRGAGSKAPAPARISWVGSGPGPASSPPDGPW